MIIIRNILFSKKPEQRTKNKKEDKKGENLDKNPTMNLEKTGLEVR